MLFWLSILSAMITFYLPKWVMKSGNMEFSIRILICNAAIWLSTWQNEAERVGGKSSPDVCYHQNKTHSSHFFACFIFVCVSLTLFPSLILTSVHTKQAHKLIQGLRFKIHSCERQAKQNDHESFQAATKYSLHVKFHFNVINYT